ncbi:Ileal sodium/bile acid cotransporter, partial [Stegodyphus mimosarum]
MCSQFVLLPLSAFCLIKVLGLNILHATGLLLLACSPGGVTSNIFTYFCEGDISLSIAMTTCSTLVALGMMPLNLYMYGQNLNQEDVVIPYGKMALSLVSVTCPVLVGMLVHWKFPRIAAYLTKIGSISGLLIIIICQTMEFFIFPDIFVNVPWQLYFAVILLPCLGFTLGYTSAWICRQKPQVRRTVSIESGVQNVGTALTVATLSFPFHNLEKVLLFPWLYAFSMTGVCIVISAFYQAYIRCSSLSKSVETLPAEREVSAVRYAEEGGKANGAYVADSVKM